MEDMEELSATELDELLFELYDTVTPGMATLAVLQIEIDDAEQALGEYSF